RPNALRLDIHAPPSSPPGRMAQTRRRFGVQDMVSSPAKSPNLDRLFSQRALTVNPSPLLQGMDDVGEKISFTFGFPDPASLPASEIAEVTTRVMAERGSAALQYGDNNGYSGLIEALLAKLKR